VAPIVRTLSPAALACLALALPAALPASASAAAPCPDAGLMPVATNMAQVKTATLCLLNVERTSRGRAPLTSDGQLGKAAQAYSAKMVRLRFFDHVCPQGTTPTSRVRGGTSYLRGHARNWSLGENIAWGSGQLATPEAIVRSWMHSAGHRRNILDRGFRNIGIGIASGAPDDVQGQPAATYTTDFGFRGLR
jgi:uncharacterized protein YkwD